MDNGTSLSSSHSYNDKIYKSCKRETESDTEIILPKLNIGDDCDSVCEGNEDDSDDGVQTIESVKSSFLQCSSKSNLIMYCV